MELLLDANADLPIPDVKGITPLKLAKQTGQTAVLQLITKRLISTLKMPGNINLAKALRKAVANAGVEGITLQHVKLLMHLIDNINDQDDNPSSKRTALHHV